MNTRYDVTQGGLLEPAPGGQRKVQFLTLCMVLGLLMYTNNEVQAQPVIAAGQEAMPSYLEHSIRGKGPAIGNSTLSILEQNMQALGRTISVDFTDVPLEYALRNISDQAGLRLSYGRGMVSSADAVSLAFEDVSVLEALHEVIRGTELKLQISRSGQLILMEGNAGPGQHDAPFTEVIQHEITGQVTSEQEEIPLPGVNVLVWGTTIGTITDAEGRFTLEAPDSDGMLVFSFVGYLTQEVPIEGRSEINVVLQQDVAALDELVVVGYGAQRRATLSGAVSSVSGSTLEQAPAINMANTLAGRLPGIVTINQSGEPGYDGATIRIRGNHTLGSNQPLIVIDGVAARAGGLDRLNPRDIESISILKDASAAIYGARAANGVILITTKRGQAGPTQFSVDVNQGFNQPTRIPEMATAAQYLEMLNELDLYRGREPSYTAEEIQNHRACADPWLYPCTDWFSEALKPFSMQSQATMSVSGGTEAMRYFLSFGGLTQDGYYRNSATRYNQYDFRTNLDGRLSSNLALAFDASGRFEDRNFPTVGAGPTFRMLMRGKPNLHAFWPNGLPGPDIENGQNPVVTGTDVTGYDNDERYYFYSNLSLALDVPGIDGLTLRGNFAYDRDFLTRQRWATPWALYSWDYQTRDANGNPVLNEAMRGPTEPQLNQWSADSVGITANVTANFQRDLPNHSYNIMLGAEQQTGRRSGFSAFRRHFISDQIDQLFAGGLAQQSLTGSATEGARMNFFGRVNYAFQSKYMIEVLGRYDGSYIFPEGNRFGFFPGVSAAWRLSQEEWFRNATGLFDELKFRASWGQTGNDDIELWQYLPSYAFGSGYVFNHNDFRSIWQQRVPNPNVTWEVANQFDVGIETTFLNNRISLEVDYFSYLRTNILHFRNASVPTTAGFSLPRENIGEVESRGFDGSITYRDQAGSNFLFSATVNLGYADNKIRFWDEPPGAPEWQRSTGSGMFTGLYYRAIGIFRDWDHVESYPSWEGARPGDIIFEDVNGDGMITADDRVRINKTGTPKWNGGLSLNASYRAFDVSVLFQGAAGAVQYILTESGDFGNYFREFADQRWTPDNPDAEGPRAFQRREEYWMEHANTFFLRETDYIRLKSLEFGYNVPPSLSGRLGLDRLRVYANGFNLLTWDNFGLMDPEARNQGGSYYPQHRVINLGVTVAF